MSMKNSNYTIGNRTRDLPVCRAVNQPTCATACVTEVKTTNKITSKANSFSCAPWTQSLTELQKLQAQQDHHDDQQKQSIQTQQLLPTGKMAKRITKWF